ncbi:MAG: glycoside hydrolase family 15 protein, partial [Pseudomonadota bacterium]
MTADPSAADNVSLNLAIIGNCTISALVDMKATIVWSCFPRFDGEAIFNRLVHEGEDASHFSIDMQDLSHTEQQYENNTAILVTKLTDTHGQSMEIVDFCPRFPHFDRLHRPASIYRIVRPVSGTPRIRVRLKPSFDYGAAEADQTHGSNHIRFVGPTQSIRLTTDASLAFVREETWFVLEDTQHFIFGPDESLTNSIEDTSRQFLRRTRDYWRNFSRYLALPYEWQSAVIRAAITLKLHSFEETGAVIAATTTSIPEAPHSSRNWDYRFCWLRDAYFVIHALNRLGATTTMEGYLTYITNVVASSEDGYLQPLFSISLNSDLGEKELSHLTGYRGMGPVRIGNAAWEQVQNDSYGAVILAATQAFFDERLEMPATERLYAQLEKV